ncbi:MAG: glycerophosphodiester phosphodiesterase family protein [Anaerolineales bacterium]|nr:glycerophosphodiester phosphodiesterase family protein [Anaerolineales bacterium]
MERNRLFELQRPIIFAHRGSSAYAPENTLSAFELAIKQNVQAIEFDVTLTKDKIVVVFHDSNTERITGHKGKINQMTLSEIKKLDAGSYFDSSFEGEKIPTLEEVFDLVGNKVLMLSLIHI